MDKDEYFKELQLFEEKFYSLTSNFNTNFPKALNLASEKKKFFNAIHCGSVYNPQFKFEKKEFDLDKFEELKHLKISLSDDLYNFKNLYKKRLKSKIYEINSHINWGKIESTEFVKKYRGKPSYLLLQKAKQYCRNYTREKIKFKRLSPETVSNCLKDEVKRLTGNNVEVIFDKEMNANVNISPINNIIKINPSVRFTNLDVKRLLVHEIGVHYMRYYNGSNFGIKILEIGTSNYIETEEGLAVYAEYLKGVNSKAQMFIYAGRVIATYYTLKKSFYEIYQILINYGFSKNIAFAITFRAKRNICDTSQKGGFTKDYVYFKGFNDIQKFVKKNDIKDLFIGKINISDLKPLKKFINENRSQIKTIFQ